ncbi:MAG: iron ABC transporter permease [Eubacterium sp.]|nr:iron ABC transporter permease [Eubacterium sp.]
MDRQHKRNNRAKRPPVWLAALVLLAAGLAVSVLAAVAIGSTDIPVSDVYHVVVYQIFGIGDLSYGQGSIFRAVWFLRLPRLVLAAAIGMSLSVCGSVMQAVVKNPLADPYVLGISSGASLGATCAILLGAGSAFGQNFIGIMAFLGSFAVSILVVILASIGGQASSMKLLLAGMALNSMCSAFSNFIVSTAHDKEGIRTVTYWMMGSLAGAGWEENGVILFTALSGTLFFWTQHRNLNLMLLGDESAVTLGTNLCRWRYLYLAVSAVMTGFAVYAAGMIGFVGLVIPHCTRMLSGTDHKKLIPLCALSGAIFLIWADVACRILVKGTELPIGILTAMIGAPFFLYLMIRKTYGFGGQ